MTSIKLGPARLDISGVRAGDRNAMTLNLTAEGAPLDLTGMTLTAQARKSASSEDVAVEAEVSIIDAAAGAVSIVWPGDAITELLGRAASWRGVWDLQIDNSGSVSTLMAGSFAAVMDVTR